MKKFKAAIFDMDGTLLDTMYMWRHLAHEYLKNSNVPVPEDITEQMAIRGLDATVDFMIENLNLNLSHEELTNALLDIIAEHYKTKAVMKKGALNFLRSLNERGISAVVLSATDEKLIQLAAERLGIMNYLSHKLLSCGTLQYTKNHPESFIKAAEYMGCKPDEVMVFEDAWYAASTAKKAGFALGVIADKEESRTAEMRELADFYIEESWDEFPIDRFF